MLGFRHPLLDQVKDKAGWNEGHGENHAYGNDDIHGSGQPAAGPERGNIRDPGKAHRRLRQSLPLDPHPQHEANHLTGLSLSRLNGYFYRLLFGFMRTFQTAFLFISLLLIYHGMYK